MRRDAAAGAIKTERISESEEVASPANATTAPNMSSANTTTILPAPTIGSSSGNQVTSSSSAVASATAAIAATVASSDSGVPMPMPVVRVKLEKLSILPDSSSTSAGRSSVDMAAKTQGSSNKRAPSDNEDEEFTAASKKVKVISECFPIALLTESQFDYSNRAMIPLRLCRPKRICLRYLMMKQKGHRPVCHRQAPFQRNRSIKRMLIDRRPARKPMPVAPFARPDRNKRHTQTLSRYSVFRQIRLQFIIFIAKFFSFFVFQVKQEPVESNEIDQPSNSRSSSQSASSAKSTASTKSIANQKQKQKMNPKVSRAISAESVYEDALTELNKASGSQPNKEVSR